MADVQRRELRRERSINGVREQRIIENNPSTRDVLVSRINQLIFLFIGILQALFALRFVMKLLAANPANPFADFLYSFTYIFLAPFATLLPVPANQEGMVVETFTLVAMVVYALVAWAMTALIAILFRDAGGTKQVTTIEQR